MPTVAHLLRDATQRLASAGVEAPRREARILLRTATGWSHAKIVAEPDAEPLPGLCDMFENLLEARVRRVPMAYLQGEVEFFDLTFAVEPGTLIPRPETELLIELALRNFPDPNEPLRILDMGTGTGCLLVTMLHHRPQADGVASDISPIALDLARRNALRHAVLDRCTLLRSSWGTGIEGAFDLILANPPYIATQEMADLQPEVALHEPVTALDGGADGLDAYRALTPDLARLLAPTGRAFLEIGHDQAGPLQLWFIAAGFTVKIHKDLAALDRCLELHRADELPARAAADAAMALPVEG